MTRSPGNVHAVLVHESPECVFDLVDNLRTMDPDSEVLLYNGGRNLRLLDDVPRDDAVHVHPKPRPLAWGKLHPFALDCFRFALDELGAGTVTIVDSDQLATQTGYAARLSAHLEQHPRIGMLGNAPELQPPSSRVSPVATAFAEVALWRPFARRFPDGADKLWHWTFWPSTVFTAAAARDLVDVFARERTLARTLRRSRMWATEEVLLPTLVALLGHELGASPFSYEFVRYNARFTAHHGVRALDREDVHWIHPVPRRYDDPLRRTIRKKTDATRTVAPSAAYTPPPPLLLPSAILDRMERVEGWLARDEGELLLAATLRAVTEVDANAVVEVGSYCGRSTVVLGSVIRSVAAKAKVYAVDPHDGTVGAPGCDLMTTEPTLERFRATLADARLAEHVETIQELSYRVDWRQPIALLLVDGLHDYENVARDFRHFEPWLARDGYVAFHDYADYYPGVKTFVDELLAGGEYERVHLVRSLIVLRKLARARRRVSAQPVRHDPLVTCVLPTFGRAEWVAHAIEYFLRQEYEPRELVVVSDGDDVASQIPKDERIRHVHLDERRTIGAKRNLGCELARGTLIANWDDDDWYASWRLGYQIAELERTRAELCGLARLLYYSPGTDEAWRYAWPTGQRQWIADSTLVFTRDFWKSTPFPDTSLAIDTRLLWNGRRKRMHVLDDERFFVGIVHDTNTSPKLTTSSLWTPISSSEIRALLGPDAERYRRRALVAAST